MKRHPAFQDLSRDHFSALLACLAVKRAVAGHEHAKPFATARRVLGRLWQDELRFHFDEEDANLTPVLQTHDAHAWLEHLESDHEDLRERFLALRATSTQGAWAAAADALRAHIRWEEDELFPWMQDNLGDEELSLLLDASVAFRTKTRGPASVHPPRP